VSNTIRYDSLLVHYLARELDERLRARRLRGVRLDSEARRFVLEMDDERLVWELHPSRGWIRLVQDAGAATIQAAAEGWAGRRIPTQRRPRIRRVTAPPDERWLEIEIDAGGQDRASRFVVELLTNQWNVIALAPDRTIVGALRSRETGGRTLRPGVPYMPPGAGAGTGAAGAGRHPREDRTTPPRREGTDAPVDRARWWELLGDLAPEERARALVRSLAWTSPLNVGAILGPAGEPNSTGSHPTEPGPMEVRGGVGAEIGIGPTQPLDDAWRRYGDIVSRPPAHPQLIELGRPTPYPLPLPGVPGRSMLSLLAALDAAAEAPATLAPEVRAALVDRLDRVRRRGERLRAEAEEAPLRAEALRHNADLLMAQLHRVSRGDTKVTLDDFAGGSVVVELDPRLGPADNAQALYDRARKRTRAAARLPERVRDAVSEGSRIESLIAAIDAGRAEPEEVERWLAEVRPADGPAGEATRLPYRRYRSSGGLEIRVGRAGRANDELTFHHAAPDDIWLHARDTAGAHVILRWNDREQNPPQRDLLEAATLAALNSRARTSGTVPVDWTRRKHVRKPRKAPPGAVIPDRVATIFVQPDPALPDRLADD
jgi:predicted ribosome quality control (RQC) complex YloA/Tae2 family protein